MMQWISFSHSDAAAAVGGKTSEAREFSFAH